MAKGELIDYIFGDEEKPDSSWVLLLIRSHGRANIWIGIQDNGGHGSALGVVCLCSCCLSVLLGWLGL